MNSWLGRAWLCTSLGLCVLLLSSAVAVPASSAESDTELTREQKKKVRSLLAKFRQARAKTARRLEIYKDLAAVGPGALAELAALVDRELAGYEKQAEQLAASTPLDAEIEKLRKVMGELRADPNLTEEKLKRIGDPAMGGLQKLMSLKVKQEQQRYQQTQRLAKQVQTWVEFFEQLPASDESELSKETYLERLGNITARFTEPSEFALAQQVAEENAKQYPKLARQTAAGLRFLNELHFALGLKPLVVDLKLCEAARGHSADMAQRGFFSHESPVPGKRTFAERAKAAGTTASAENIYQGSSSSRTAILGWFHSPGHHKNMFGAHERQGLGHAGGHWTQVFGK